MNEYILLGIIQGIFEWIPISSEGVVALSSQFLVEDFRPVDLSLFLHLGTLFAVLVYFKKDWQEILTLKNLKLLKFLLITTLISLIVGYPLYKMIEDVVVGSALLMVMGFGLLITAYFNKTKRTFKVSPKNLAIVAGFLQGLSIIPGLSRSGATIFGLSLGKTEPQEVLKVSYLMSAPVVFVSSVYLFLKEPTIVFEAWPALIFSFVLGILTLGLLLKIAQRIEFFKFALIFSFLCFLGAAISFLI
ncbi:MAG TPA: undecaprenyl-diphosphate phosphatase [Candidatus Humimicrobiaceae bacterium]|nr:undecaprenyl-diphosphate phosphatase [Candidatus Humimicrobiaceae bacterium]